MIDRRVLLGGLLTLYFIECSHSATDDGCWIDAKLAKQLLGKTPQLYSFEGTGPNIIRASGNDLLDKALARALMRICRDLDVLPGFAFYDGDGAHATTEMRMDRADGTVLMGLGLLRKLLARPIHPDACVVAVCAHEFGHILQFKRGVNIRLRPSLEHPSKPVELHADFLSGYFSGLRKLNTPDYPAVVFAHVVSELSPSNSHGSPQERSAAVEAGFISAVRDKLSLGAAIEVGIRHVQGRSS